MLQELLLALVPLFVIVDPFASMGLYLGLTKGMDARSRMTTAVKASLFAAGVLVLFSAGGKQMMSYLGIELYALQVAGGLLLVMIGLRMLREGEEVPLTEVQVALPTGGRHDLNSRDGDPSYVPLGLPMLAGPGAISLVIVQTTNFGISTVVLSIFIVMLASLLVLVLAAKMHVYLGQTGSRVLTRIMGILTVAFAAQYVLDGIGGWVDAR